jgi:hypothetical protein
VTTVPAAARYEANEQYYGKPVYPMDILAGTTNPPVESRKLLDVSAKY